MTTTNRSEPPNRYNVRGLNPQQRAAWDRLSARPTVPTKYPKNGPLKRLGLHDDFWRLCDTGDKQGLTHIFSQQWPTYRRYTLEFLSTLKLIRERAGRFQTVRRIEFRLSNEDRVLTCNEFAAIFECRLHDDEDNLDHDEFWQMITIGERPFESGKAKSSAIRNPVLRYLHRAIANVVFARGETGNVNNNELFLLYRLLRGQGTLLSHHMPTHWHRVAQGTSGSINCGGPFTAICAHYGIELDEDEAVPGDMLLTYDHLANVDLFQRDQANRAYIFQRRVGDHFPLPSPDLTRVHAFEYQDNWKMNTPSHQRVIAAYPPELPWKLHQKPLRTLCLDPEVSERGESSTRVERLGQPDIPPANLPNMDLPPRPSYTHRYQQHHRRRQREQPPAEFQESVLEQLGHLCVGQTNMQNQNNTGWGRQETWFAQDQEWQSHEGRFWNEQRARDQQQMQLLQLLQRDQQETREEVRGLRGEVASLTDLMQQLSANLTNFVNHSPSHYPPPPPPQ